MRASELALGCGLLGARDGRIDPAVARDTLALFAASGGTLIDTSSAHGDGRSEEMVGRFVREHGRDRFVVSTKYGRRPAGDPASLAGGAHRGAMLSQVEASLRRLGTDRVDLFSVEFPDGVTPLDEILRGMDALVRQGKVVAFALSNFAAWKVAHAATLAELRGWAPVAAIHHQYNLVERTVEREHLEMADALGLAVLAWSPQARGALARTPLAGLPAPLAAALEAVAAARGAIGPGPVALAWSTAKGVFPVVGARDPDQLRGCLQATGIALDPGETARLDDAAPRSAYPEPLLALMRQNIGVDDGMLWAAARGGASPA